MTNDQKEAIEHYRRVLKNANDMEHRIVTEGRKYFSTIIEEAIQDRIGWFADGYPHIHLIEGYESLEEKQLKNEIMGQVHFMVARIMYELYEESTKRATEYICGEHE